MAGLFCPFAHRVNILRHLKGLIYIIDVSIVKLYPKGDDKAGLGGGFQKTVMSIPELPSISFLEVRTFMTSTSTRTRTTREDTRCLFYGIRKRTPLTIMYGSLSRRAHNDERWQLMIFNLAGKL